MTEEEMDLYFARRMESQLDVTITPSADDPGADDVNITPKSDFEASCDFCGVSCVPLRTHEAYDVEIYPGQWSKGDWAGCDLCSGFIYKMDSTGLLNRGIEQYFKKLGRHDFIPSMVNASHYAFWKARKEPQSAP